MALSKRREAGGVASNASRIYNGQEMRRRDKDTGRLRPRAGLLFSKADL